MVCCYCKHYILQNDLCFMIINDPSATYSLSFVFDITCLHTVQLLTLYTKFKHMYYKNNDAIFPVSFMTLRKMPNKKAMNLKKTWFDLFTTLLISLLSTICNMFRNSLSVHYDGSSNSIGCVTFKPDLPLCAKVNGRDVRSVLSFAAIQNQKIQNKMRTTLIT